MLTSLLAAITKGQDLSDRETSFVMEQSWKAPCLIFSWRHSWLP